MVSYTQIHLTVLGVPVAKGRPRFRKVGKYVQTYTPAKTKKAEQEISLELLREYPGFITQVDKEKLDSLYGRTAANALLRNAAISKSNRARTGAGCSEESAIQLQVQGKEFGIRIQCEFYIPIPSSLSKKKKTEMDGKLCLKKPDIDNYVKLVCDALNGIAWEDDNEVAEVYAIKRYSNNPRTEVSIYYYQNRA